MKSIRYKEFWHLEILEFIRYFYWSTIDFRSFWLSAVTENKRGGLEVDESNDWQTECGVYLRESNDWQTECGVYLRKSHSPESRTV
jgi:hypothetical protein